jgi:hypothetical protein
MNYTKIALGVILLTLGGLVTYSNYRPISCEEFCSRQGMPLRFKCMHNDLAACMCSPYDAPEKTTSVP